MAKKPSITLNDMKAPVDAPNAFTAPIVQPVQHTEKKPPVAKKQKVDLLEGLPPKKEGKQVTLYLKEYETLKDLAKEKGVAMGVLIDALVKGYMGK